MWFRLMMMAFFINGLSPFGLRILAGLGLADHYTPIYLVFWYLSGGLFIIFLFAPRTFQSTKSLTFDEDEPRFGDLNSQVWE